MTEEEKAVISWSKLKPCPFCGCTDLHIERAERGSAWVGTEIKCTGAMCGATMFDHCHGDYDTIDEWSGRFTPKTTGLDDLYYKWNLREVLG